MSNVNFVDNKNGTIIKTVVEDNGVVKKYAYDFLVGTNIPKDEFVDNYCYFQHEEESLVPKLEAAGIGEWVFCSGTCVAMVLAISRGDISIKPEHVIYWENTKDENGNSVKNWDNGLKDWEQEEDLNGDGGQIYDNRDQGAEGGYAAIDGSTIKNGDKEKYLKNLKMYLSAGLPVIIEFPNEPHYVVVVGVESNVKLEAATFDQLVIFDPGRSDDKKIVTLGESQYSNSIRSNRMLTPYPIVRKTESGGGENSQRVTIPDPIDDRWEFVTDENGAKTHDPYYIDPATRADGSIIPAYAGRPLKEAIAAVNNSLMSQEDKEEKIERLVKTFTGDTATENALQSYAQIFDKMRTLSKINLSPDGYSVQLKLEDEECALRKPRYWYSFYTDDKNGSTAPEVGRYNWHDYLWLAVYRGDSFVFAAAVKAIPVIYSRQWYDHYHNRFLDFPWRECLAQGYEISSFTADKSSSAPKFDYAITVNYRECEKYTNDSELGQVCYERINQTNVSDYINIYFNNTNIDAEEFKYLTDMSDSELGIELAELDKEWNNFRKNN